MFAGLVDGDEWAAWNSGVATVGSRIAGGQLLVFPSRATPARLFAARESTSCGPARLFLGGGIALGPFRGTRTNAQTSDGAGPTWLQASGEDPGPHVPLTRRSMPDLGPSVEQLAEGLLARAGKVG
jgi:hypothetical protein